jgi:hypothetical protein
LAIDSSGKKIDGIPDASGFKYSVSAGQPSHRYCSGDATLDASRYRVGFQGKPDTEEFRCDGHALDNAALCCDAVFFEHDRNGLFVLVRKYFAEPPDATGHTQDNAEDADRNARKQAREHQAEAKSQNDWPGGGCRYLDLIRSPASLI